MATVANSLSSCKSVAASAWERHMLAIGAQDFTPTPSSLPASATVLVRYCRFHDAAGYAVRDGQRRCFYVAPEAHFTLLDQRAHSNRKVRFHSA